MYLKQQLLQQTFPKLSTRRTDAVYRSQSISYILKSKLAMDGRLLIIAFYNRESAANGFSLPSVVLFHTKQEYIAIQNSSDGQKWKECRVLYALGIKNRNKEQVIGLTERDEQRIRAFLPLKRKEYQAKLSVVEHIEEYQNKLLEERLKAKKKKIAAQVDRRMQITPKLPDAFPRWIDRGPFLHSRYLYYRRITKRTAECFCTHCKKDIILHEEIPVHNSKGVCPACHSGITFKAIGKSTKIQDEAKAAILQKTRVGKEYMIRYFSVSRSFRQHYRDPEDHLYERARLIFTSDGTITGQYKYGWNAKTGRYGWYSSNDTVAGKNSDIKWEIRLGMYQSVWNVWFDPVQLYPCNLHPMLKSLNLSYDIIRNIKGRAIDVTSYLMRSMLYPFAPSLWRIGLTQLCADLLEECYEPHVYSQTGSIHTRFGISKVFMDFMRRHNLGLEAVKLRAALNKEPDEKEFLWMLENKIAVQELRSIKEHATFHKIKQYIERQLQKCTVNTWDHQTPAQKLMVFWKDYISMSKKLGYDLSKRSVLFPRNIRDEHDKVQQLTKIKHDPIMSEKIKSIYPELHRVYSFADANYQICPQGILMTLSRKEPACSTAFAQTAITVGMWITKAISFFCAAGKRPTYRFTPLNLIQTAIEFGNARAIATKTRPRRSRRLQRSG